MNFYDVKEDWGEVKKRWTAWWNCEMYDRPLILISTPKKKPVLPPEIEAFRYDEDNLIRKWTDTEYMSNRTLHQFYNTYYGGESVPVFNHNWSVGHALVFGCKPNFAHDTIWTDPVTSDGEERPEIRFEEDGYWWKWLVSATEDVARRSKQRYYVMPMWGNNAGDNLLMVRGTNNLLFDILEDPEWVKRSIKYISDSMIRQFNTLRPLSELTGLEGSVNYVGAWSPKKTMGFDCDLSCMISQELFKNIFLPPLIETMQTVDHCIYHLDGTGALHQLDSILAVKEVNAIQWVPGAGREPIMQWVDLVNKIQENKKAVLCYAEPECVIPFIKEVHSEGLCIQTYAESEDEARALIEKVERLYE